MRITHTIATRKRAFTLIELMVAVLIIALISAFATTNFLAAQRNARDNARKATVNAIATAVESYYAAKRTFPGRTDAAADVGGAPTNITQYNDAARGCQFILDYGVTGEYPYLYSYVPYTQGQDCDNPPTPVPPLAGPSGSLTVYGNSLYLPTRSWIPGLGDYLSPTPIERRFSDVTGSGIEPYANPPAADLLGTTYLRTLQYRRLDGGYMVSAKLENSAIDQDAIPTGTNDAQPYLPKRFRSAATGGTGTGITNTNVYIIRK